MNATNETVAEPGVREIEPPTFEAAPDVTHKSPSQVPKWPQYHLTGPWGWMNDPCGPGYDPITETYHLFYQWNPKGTNWGDISWGQLTSKDMLQWQRNGAEPAIAPGKETEEKTDYDNEAIFTGCMYPTGPNGEPDKLTAIYTSVRQIPFHWSTPYPRGAAGLSAAVSHDHGVTWDKHPDNPFLNAEPEDLTVTGWRDPYLHEWPDVAKIRGKDPTTLYGVMSGGILKECSAVFLYEVEPNNLLEWKYLGPLMTNKIGFRPSHKWCGDGGVNWECTNFMTLTSSSGTSRDFLITGTEGGDERDHISPPEPTVLRVRNSVSAASQNELNKQPERVPRWTMWVSGVLRLSDDGKGVTMDYKFGGMFDHGVLYAPNSFVDGKTGKRVVWGWLIEEDVPLEYCEAKGWTGCLSLPREIYLQELREVTRTIKSSLDTLAAFEVERSEGGSDHIVRTMGIRPLNVVDGLRQGAPFAQIDRFSHLELPRRSSLLMKSDDPEVLSSVDVLVPGTRWEIEARIRILPNCHRVGFRLQIGPAVHERATVYFNPVDEEIGVKRPTPTHARRQSSAVLSVNDREERGAHTLFKFANGKLEPLYLRIFRDGQILEVFANDRFALSTMIYGQDEGAHNEVVKAFTEVVSDTTSTDEPVAVFEDVKVFEMAQSIVNDTYLDNGA